jgi:small subunit ribosomal protein S7
VAKCTTAPLQRQYASDSANLPVAENREGPNQEQLPHVSEEAAAMGEVMGETSPDIEEHGTPVQEVRIQRTCAPAKLLSSTLQILEREAEAKEKAPEVMKNNSNSPTKPNTNPAGSSQSRSYSTTTRRNAELIKASLSSEMGPPLGLGYPNGGLGHKFGLPDMPLPRTEHFRRRYEPVVEQLTKSLMRHGKLSVAQKVCSS